MQRKIVMKYIVLGASLGGITRYFFSRYGTGSLEDNLKLLFVSLFTSTVGYMGVRFINVAYCESTKEPEDRLDKAMAQVKDRWDKTVDDIRVHLDQKSQELWSHIRDNYMSGPVREAFEFLDTILENLREFGHLDKKEFQTPLPILLALVKKAQDDISKSLAASLPEESKTPLETIKLHHHFSHYAVKVYEASSENKREKQAEALGIEENDIVFTSFQDREDAHTPKFVILNDKENDCLVLAVRGTFSLSDIFMDIVCDEEEFLDGFAHRGIARGMRKAMEEAGPILQEHFKNRSQAKKKLIVTGHSLGAGAAELITMEILTHPGEYIPSDVAVECIALAPPPVYRSVKPLPHNIVEAIHIYINNEDCIPRMSLGTIASLLMMIRTVDSLPLTNYEKFQILTGLTETEESVTENLHKLQRAVSEAKQDRFPFLEHPGQVNYLHKSKSSSDEVFVIPRDSSIFAQQLLLLDRMVLDHLKTCYHSSFEKAILRGDKKSSSD